jgi:hypothetical protein
MFKDHVSYYVLFYLSHLLKPKSLKGDSMTSMSSLICISVGKFRLSLIWKHCQELQVFIPFSFFSPNCCQLNRNTQELHSSHLQGSVEFAILKGAQSICSLKFQKPALKVAKSLYSTLAKEMHCQKVAGLYRPTDSILCRDHSN